MLRIFQIMNNDIVYIDNIMLFSLDINSHHTLLLEFHDLVKSYEIMLAQTKIIIDETNIDFLGMHMSKGQH